MNRTVLAGGGAVLVAVGLAAGAVPARTDTGSAGAWVHVRVHEKRDASKVSVNLPLSVVEAVLEAAPERIADKGHIRIDLGRDHDHDLDLDDMRRIWRQLKDAGDTELVSVEEGDETVKVARKGDLVQVHVSKPSEQEEVHVDVPVNLVDAVLSGEGDTVDVKMVIRELRNRRGDIVRVNDKDSAVRIWIDEAAGQEK